MATLRNERKLAALNKENCEKLLRRNLAQNSNAPKLQEDYMTQVSKDIEGRVTKKLSQEFSRTEKRILGSPSRLYDFLMNPLTQCHSETAPGTSRNAHGTNQETNADDSQNIFHPEASFSQSQTTRSSGPEDGHDRVTGVHQEVTYYSPSTTSGKPKKTALPVNRNFAVRTPLRHMKQAKLCWPFSSWQIATILRNFQITSTEFPNSECDSPQRCPPLTRNLRNSSCLKTVSK